MDQQDIQNLLENLENISQLLIKEEYSEAQFELGHSCGQLQSLIYMIEEMEDGS